MTKAEAIKRIEELKKLIVEAVEKRTFKDLAKLAEECTRLLKEVEEGRYRE